MPDAGPSADAAPVDPLVACKLNRSQDDGSTPPQIQFKVAITDVLSNKPLNDADASISACTGVDTGCNNPITTAPLVGGGATFTGPALFDRMLLQAPGELQIDNYFVAYGFWNEAFAPLSDGTQGLALRATPLAAIEGLTLAVTNGKDQYDPKSVVFNYHISSCPGSNNHGLPSVSLDISRFDQHTFQYILDSHNSPNPSIAATDTEGSGGAVNVPAGNVTLTWSYSSDGKNKVVIGRLNRTMLAGTVTLFLL